MTAPLEAGARLGPYLLQQRLGAGGSAEVWEALLEGPGGFQKPVALKLLRAGLERDADHHEALLREARLGARLQHPNLVATLLLSSFEDRLGVALELVRGPTVQDLRRGLGGPLPPGALLEIALQTSQALSYIHGFALEGRTGGLVHRDVKPSNLLVDVHGVVKLADLGISLPSGETGGVAGTPGYLPPEQADGAAEPRSDLFALGVTLYLLASGRMPFGRGLSAIAQARSAEIHLRDPAFLAPVEAHLPGLGAVVRSCLRLRPQDRPASADELHRDLLALLPSARSGPSLRELVRGGSPPSRPEAPSQESGGSTRLLLAGNLRPSRDAFIGRRDELQELCARVEREPWIVVLGPGGLGKTRLALEVARSVQRRFPGGAWAFDLTEARTADGLCASVAHALRVPLEARDPVLQLGHALAAKGRCLVILDNLEQCVEALPATLGRWLSLAPEARFLGTSRIRPGLPEESLVPLGELLPTDATQLFVKRSPRPLGEAELALVPGLCESLDHMPLPLELAAARLRLLPLADVARRLSLKLLAGGGQERPERHRSVDASVAWSWELLSEPARQGLLQLSVFEGGFDWSAAEAVMDLGAGAPWSLDVLQELVDASLLRVDRASGRLSPWVVVREFARDRLLGEARLAAEDRHGRHFAGLDPEAPSLAADLDNVVAACRGAARRGEDDIACRTLRLALEVLSVRGPVDAGLALAAEVRAAVTTPSGQAKAALLWGRAQHAAGQLKGACATLEEALSRLGSADGDLLRALSPAHVADLQESLAKALGEVGRAREAEPLLQEALAAARALGDRRRELRVLSQLGQLRHWGGRVQEARDLYVRNLAMARELGSRAASGAALCNLGNLLWEVGEMKEARGLYEQALELLRADGGRRNEGVVLGNLANLLRALGQGKEALDCYEQAAALQREVGGRRALGVVLGNLGALHQEQGRAELALENYEQALALHREVGNRRFEGVALAALGTLHQSQGRREQAWKLFQEAQDIHRAIGNRHHQGVVLFLLAVLHAEEGRLEEARSDFGQSEAIFLELSERLELARVWFERACLEAGAGHRDRAERDLTRGMAVVAELGVGEDSELGRAGSRARAVVAALPPAEALGTRG